VKIKTLLPSGTEATVSDNQNKEGLLVVFCGVDGAGKTSAIQAFCQEMESRGISHALFRNHVGDALYWRSTMRSKEQVIKAGLGWPADVDRVLQAAEFLANTRFVLPHLLVQNSVVVSDRYDVAKLVYARVKHRGGIGTAERMLTLAQDIPRPDVIFYLSVSAQTASDRISRRIALGGKQRDWKERREIIEKALYWYDFFLNQPTRSEVVMRIETERPLELVHEEIIERFLLYLQSTDLLPSHSDLDITG